MSGSGGSRLAASVELIKTVLRSKTVERVCGSGNQEGGLSRRDPFQSSPEAPLVARAVNGRDDPFLVVVWSWCDGVANKANEPPPSGGNPKVIFRGTSALGLLGAPPRTPTNLGMSREGACTKEPVDPRDRVRFRNGRVASTIQATDDAGPAPVPLRRPPMPRLRRAIASLWRRGLTLVVA
ncbi:hypothetical protein LZ30DRAFT_687564 [Colletotrichum cereale]|nr:hypothetical protein LZ30DRAFT_687564 [Colletotrichum cereale]